MTEEKPDRGDEQGDTSRESEVGSPGAGESSTPDGHSTPDVGALFTGPIRLKDTRRVPGPNLLWDRPGVVLDVEMPGDIADRVIATWDRDARRMLDAVGWSDEATRVRRFPGGATLALSAPIDALLAATEVNEWALLSAQAELVGGEAPAFDEALTRLRELIAAERKPVLLALWQEARSRQVSCLIDDELVSIGCGTGSLTWPIGAVPTVETIDWGRVYDIPTVLITGSNGKTTSTRLLATVLSSTGRVVGMSCTDSVTVGGDVIAAGDWAGPGGARMVLRDPRAELAVLETARGGILRRGLAVTHASAAIVTNIAEDHFGEFGIHDLDALAEAKLVVSRALGPEGLLVLNADDPVLARLGARAGPTICWFSLDARSPIIRQQVSSGGKAVWLEQGEIRVSGWSGATTICSVAELPIAHGGAAAYNIANTLGVIAAALALGLDPGTIRRGLTSFKGTPADNPGRLNLFEFGEAHAVVDFAHNPHGMDALIRMALSLPARRRLLMLGQAGDRDDESIRELARSGWALGPDRIVLKEMEKYRRGRAEGEVSGMLRDEFIRLGAAADSMVAEPSEYDALIASLQWARPGDLLVLPLHAERDRGLALLEELRRSGWRAGEPLVISR